MNKFTLVPVILFAIALLAVSPAMANSTEGRYSYIQVESVDIEVIGLNEASFDVNYKIDDNVNFLVLLLGKSDLKQKICEIFDLENSRFERVDMDGASFHSNIQSYNNGDGTYWFPERTFRTDIPNLTVKAQESYKKFDLVREFPGIGYYYGNNA